MSVSVRRSSVGTLRSFILRTGPTGLGFKRDFSRSKRRDAFLWSDEAISATFTFTLRSSLALMSDVSLNDCGTLGAFPRELGKTFTKVLFVKLRNFRTRIEEASRFTSDSDYRRL